MIILPLLDHIPLRDVITYSVSPLFELAASLHMLAQPSSPEPLKKWTEETLRAFQTARLSTEWQYFAPVFRFQIPDSFDPFHTKGIMAVDDQYDYFVTLPTDQFCQSLKTAMEALQNQEDTQPICHDLMSDPEFVQSRFSLFISSYWQLFFEAKWEEIAPQFVREAERIEQALVSGEKVGRLLNGILPDFRYNSDLNRLELDNRKGSQQIRQLILYPSHFHVQSPSLVCKEFTAHLVYHTNCNRK
jgi:hypothetical protein